MDEHSRAGFALPFQCFAVFGVYVGTSLLGMHGSAGGAWGIAQLGAAFSIASMLALEVTLVASPLWRTNVMTVTALVAFFAAAWNFCIWPPIDDGAYFLGRYRHAVDTNGLFPASADRHAHAFAVVAWAVYLAAAPSSGDAHRAMSRLHFAPRVILGVALAWGMAEAFTTFAHARDPTWEYGLIVGVLVVGSLASAVWRRSQLALLVACFALATAFTTAFFRLLEALPLWR